MQRRLIPCLASAVVIRTRKNGGRREKAASKSAFGSTMPHPRTGRTCAGPREKSVAVAAGAGRGPGTEGMRREAVIGSTGGVRHEQAFVDGSASGSSRAIPVMRAAKEPAPVGPGSFHITALCGHAGLAFTTSAEPRDELPSPAHSLETPWKAVICESQRAGLYPRP